MSSDACAPSVPDDAVSMHTLRLGDLTRELPIVPLSAHTRVAYLNLYGDGELLAASAEGLCSKLDDEVDLIIGPEAGGILLAHLLAERALKPYAIVRKKVRPDMRHPLCTTVTTPTTGAEQLLVLGDAEIEKVRGCGVAIVDEVVSTGATVVALRELIERAGGHVVQVLALAIEGEPRADVSSLCHLPLFSS